MKLILAILLSAQSALGANQVDTFGIKDAAVTNVKMASMANATFKCRTSAGTGVPEDCNASQVNALLNAGTQSANTVYAGPSSGSPAAPTYRALVGEDLPLPISGHLGGILSNSCLTHNFFNSLNTSGALSCVQPDFSDLNGTAATGQMPAHVVYENVASAFTAKIVNSVSPVASTPALKLTGGVYVAGTGATNTPSFLIDDGTSSAWSTAGTYFGIDATSLFSGNLIDLQLNGTSKFKVDYTGKATGNGSGLTNLAGANIASASVPNSALVNAATTVSGQACTLGSTCTVPFSGLSGSASSAQIPSDVAYYDAAQTWSANQSINASAWTRTVANAGTTGTTAGKLAKLNPSGNAVITSTSDTEGAVGVVISGAGTTSSAQIAVAGQTACVSDNTTVVNDYATISSTTAGDCHDAGATYPTSGQVVGRWAEAGAAGAHTLFVDWHGPTLSNLSASNLSTGTVPAARIPNPSSSTLGGVQSYASVSHQWINTISTSGVPASTQPAFPDISGTATVAQTTVGNQAQSTCNTSATIDWSTGTQFTMLLTNGATCAVTFSNAVSGQVITIDYTQPASTGSAVVSYATTVKWATATVPTMTTGVSKSDSCTFKYNGTDYRGSCIQDMR